MTIEEIKARKAEISEELKSADITEDRISALENEVSSLEAEERKIIENAEARKAEEAKVIEAAKSNQGSNITLPEGNEKKGNKTMTLEEMRSSRDYAAAWLNGLKKHDDNFDEARALLTVNTTGDGLTGYVPVPTQLETEIQTAWEENELVGYCKKSFFKGDVAIGFELSATGAVVHVEGTVAPDEEVVTLGVVNIKSENIKKWITVSDEALEGTTVDTMGYILKEIAYQIVKKAENILISKITSAGTAASSTAVGVPNYTCDTIGTDTLVQACAFLAGDARDLRIAMNRQTYPAFISAAHAAKYSVDVFNGLKDKIVYTDQLPAKSAATTTNPTYAIVGDFGRGALVNLPNGNGIKMKVDDASLAEKDLVKIVGRQYAGIGLIADKHFVRISISTST